jgi:pimeloyl-ACP methyl ester carboxylesterase
VQWLSPRDIAPGTTPVVFVHGINSDPGAWSDDHPPVSGTSKSPLCYIVDKVGSDKVTGYTFDWSRASGHTSHGDTPIMWVDSPLNPTLGDDLSEAIDCAYRAAGHAVIIVGHSMGGLLAQYATHQHPDAVAGVITVGTPHQGSWLATGFSSHRPCLRPPRRAGLVARMVKTACDLSGIKDSAWSIDGLCRSGRSTC